MMALMIEQQKNEQVGEDIESEQKKHYNNLTRKMSVVYISITRS